MQLALASYFWWASFNIHKAISGLLLIIFEQQPRLANRGFMLFFNLITYQLVSGNY